MAQPHLAPGEVGSVRPLGGELPHTQSHALLKSPQLEVMRLVLLAGKTMPGHRVPGEITVQCLEGVVDFHFDGQARRLHAGDFVHLAGSVPHQLTALEDASLLVTICLLPT